MQGSKKKVHLQSNTKGVAVPSMDEIEEVVINAVLELVTSIQNTELMPFQWIKAFILSLFRRGDRSEYRVIALLEMIYKVIATLVKRQLASCIESALGGVKVQFRIKEINNGPTFQVDTNSLKSLRIRNPGLSGVCWLTFQGTENIDCSHKNDTAEHNRRS